MKTQGVPNLILCVVVLINPLYCWTLTIPQGISKSRTQKKKNNPSERWQRSPPDFRQFKPDIFACSSSSPSSSDGSSSSSSMSESKLTDWVIENLESENESVTSISSIQAGENDTLPIGGLLIPPFCIVPAGMIEPLRYEKEESTTTIPIRLLLGRNGWGTGVHPTTRLCLEWLSMPSTIRGGELILDYGCGSGILSIAALSLGASKVVGVDVEAEALVTAERNLELNGYGDRFEGMHTREVIPGCLYSGGGGGGADVCLANILVGQLVRPSMISAIVTNLQRGAWLCLSGIRPHEVPSLKEAYGDYIDWEDDHYAELSAKETENSIQSYGFDVGTWARLVGRRRKIEDNDGMDVEAMSDLAVS